MLVLVVKPVLLDQRNDLVLHDFFHPVFGAIMRCAFAEVAVSYTKVAPKRSVGCYGSVQLFDFSISASKVSLLRVFWYALKPSESNPGSILKKQKRLRKA
jgi:hypothetical protein